MDERTLQADLVKRDRGLILVREWDTVRDCPFYVVRHRDDPDVVILDWREPDDTPRQLSSGILTEIDRKMHAGPTSLKKLAARQAELRERKDAESLENYRAVAAEFKGKDSPVHAPLLHRGVHLRRHREKLRSQGRRDV